MIIPDLKLQKESNESLLLSIKRQSLRQLDWKNAGTFTYQNIIDSFKIDNFFLSSVSDLISIDENITADNGAKGLIIQIISQWGGNATLRVQVTSGDFTGAVTITVDETLVTATIDSSSINHERLIALAEIPANNISTGIIYIRNTLFSGGTLDTIDMNFPFKKNLLPSTSAENFGNLSNNSISHIQYSNCVVRTDFTSPYTLYGYIVVTSDIITALTQGSITVFYKTERISQLL